MAPSVYLEVDWIGVLSGSNACERGGSERGDEPVDGEPPLWVDPFHSPPTIALGFECKSRLAAKPSACSQAPTRHSAPKVATHLVTKASGARDFSRHIVLSSSTALPRCRHVVRPSSAARVPCNVWACSSTVTEEAQSESAQPIKRPRQNTRRAKRFAVVSSNLGATEKSQTHTCQVMRFALRRLARWSAPSGQTARSGFKSSTT